MHVWAKRGYRVGGKVWAQGGLHQGALESTVAEVGRQEAQCRVLMGLQVVQNPGTEGCTQDLETWDPEHLGSGVAPAGGMSSTGVRDTLRR